jgi:hypothetical protein
VRDGHGEWRQAIAGALQQAQGQGADLQTEVEFFTAVLALLDGETSALPAGHPYAEALAQIQAGIASGAPEVPVEAMQEIAQSFGPVLEAVMAFLNADDWEASRRVIEARQDLLLRQEAEIALLALIAQAEAGGNQDAVRVLQMHLEILRACKADGIDAAFAQLE